MVFEGTFTTLIKAYLPFSFIFQEVRNLGTGDIIASLFAEKNTQSFILQKLRLQKKLMENSTGRREDIKVYFRVAKTILYEQG